MFKYIYLILAAMDITDVFMATNIWVRVFAGLAALCFIVCFFTFDLFQKKRAEKKAKEQAEK